MSFSVEEIKRRAAEMTLEDLKAAAKEQPEDINFAFAACFSAVDKGLGLIPFDEQLLAAKALDDGEIAEMSTGEGKTLAAVFAVYYNVLNGRRVHVLTFNDYLARRDVNWMKPVYELLGVKTALITEATPHSERKNAYKADVVYLTAKESGFDFLRDFVVFDERDMVHCGFDMAIVDEADSILIDEARIPLVIAGNVAVDEDADMPEISEFVKTLGNDDFEINGKMKTAYLSDSGAAKTEEHYGLENVYDDENNELLTKINDCLKAQKILARDKDYVLKNGEIQLVDEFTGRIARNRHYPGSLQAAVEVLNDVRVTTRGTIMGTVPLQFFIRQYKKLAGMTGTAESAKEEFFQLYNLNVTKIAPHKPSMRDDKPLAVYYNGAAKLEAIIERIIAAHQKNQPVLVGTTSIEKSEELARKLSERGVDNVSVLNAKNDEMEAEIVKNAGALGSVTISTNMAGRGVDIKLGGYDETTRDSVIEAGGLLVIGTEMSESARINAQLMGRSGRQGDVGETQIFTALDDMIMRVYDIKSLIPSRHWPNKTMAELDDKIILRETARIQRIAEGDTLESRKRLLKFTMIGEKHRDATFEARMRYLSGERKPDIWAKNSPEEYSAAVKKFGGEKLEALEKELILAAINDFWTEYLEFSDNLREGIHLTEIGGKNPTEEFNISCENYYDGMEEQLVDYLLEKLDEILQLNSIDDYKVKKPESTQTYLLENVGSELEHKAFLTKLLGENPEIESGLVQSDEDEGEKKGFFKSLFGKKSKD